MTDMRRLLSDEMKRESDVLLHMIFTRGHCHSLGLAIIGIIGRGTLVVAGENGNIEHAAAFVDGDIIDIEGKHSWGAALHR